MVSGSVVFAAGGTVFLDIEPEPGTAVDKLLVAAGGDSVGYFEFDVADATAPYRLRGQVRFDVDSAIDSGCVPVAAVDAGGAEQTNYVVSVYNHGSVSSFSGTFTGPGDGGGIGDGREITRFEVGAGPPPPPPTRRSDARYRGHGARSPTTIPPRARRASVPADYRSTTCSTTYR